MEPHVTGPHLAAWKLLIRAHCTVLRVLDADLRSAHGMTLSDYDVLVSLRDCEHGALRMSELSNRVMLTRSGMTRLVQGLERDGLVARRSCSEDARVSFVALTAAGIDRLTDARRTHHAGIRRLFADHFDDESAQQLADLLERIPGMGDACSSDGADGSSDDGVSCENGAGEDPLPACD